MAAKLRRCRVTWPRATYVLTHLITTGRKSTQAPPEKPGDSSSPVPSLSALVTTFRAPVRTAKTSVVSSHLPVAAAAAAAIRRRRPIESVARSRVCLHQLHSRTGRATTRCDADKVASQLRHLIIAHSLLVDADVRSRSASQGFPTPTNHE